MSQPPEQPEQPPTVTPSNPRRLRRWPLFAVFGVLLAVVAGFAILSQDAVDPAGAAKAACEQFVKQRLGTAARSGHVFIATSATNASGGRYIVTGDVDSQNHLGVTLRDHYRCEVADQHADWQLISLIFAGR